jgi:hypothetical protein
MRTKRSEQSSAPEKHKRSPHGNSYLPGCGTADAAREKAAKSLLEFAGVHLPVHLPDGDDAPDFNEMQDSSAPVFRLALFEPEPTECLGPACPLSSEACDRCRFFESQTDSEPEFFMFAEASALIDRLQHEPADALRDLYQVAPMARGHRATRELRFASRVKF